MSVLVLAEHVGGQITASTLSAVTAAGQLGPVTLLVAGDGDDTAAAAQAGAAIAGVEKVLLAKGPALAGNLPETIAPLVVGLMAGRRGFVAAATTTGKNIAPRVAALLDVMQVSEVLSIEGPATFTRPIYAGNAIATVESGEAQLVLTVRPTAFARADLEGGNAPVEEIASPGDNGQSRFIGISASVSERPELTSANIVVSGGRALKDAETFAQVIIPLADKLGAAIGASRAAVDAGYISNDHQVGQTGKIVAPQLYLAVGISGAIQHLAGMKDSKVIVAINKDPDAPIFQVADVGLVADLFTAVPELVAKI